MIKLLFLSGICIVFLLAATMMVKADMTQLQQTLNPGWILVAPLADFAPQGEQRNYDLLQNGRYAEAASGFKQALAKNENDLVAFVGLAQADPASWPSAITRLEGQVKSHEGLGTQFKLGTIYFYEWKANPSKHSKDILRSQRLLAQAWQHWRLPIVGLLYAEVYETSSGDLARTLLTLNQIIAGLAGPQAMRYYEQARASDWEGETPSVQRTPTANLKPLRGVLKLAWSLSSIRVGHGVMQGNNIKMVYDPVPAEQQKQAAYLLKWRNTVDEAIARA